MNEGHKAISLHAISVQVIRFTVGGGNDSDIVAEEIAKQTLHHHRISHIRHLELVEEQHVIATGDITSDLRKRVTASSFTSELNIGTYHISYVTDGVSC